MLHITTCPGAEGRNAATSGIQVHIVLHVVCLSGSRGTVSCAATFIVYLSHTVIHPFDYNRLPKFNYSQTFLTHP